MSEFFLELFSEEMPAILQKSARENLLKLFKENFEKKKFSYKSGISYSTPNRLVFFFQGIPNNIQQKDGGTHLLGFRSALTRIINKYISEKNLAKKNKVTVGGEDIKEGLTVVLSIKMPDPKFSSQTKDKLVSSEVRPVVEGLVGENLTAWLEENPSESKIIIQKVLDADKYAGGFVPQNTDEIKLVQDLGINFLTYNVDSAIVYNSVKEIINLFKSN